MLKFLIKSKQMFSVIFFFSYIILFFVVYIKLRRYDRLVRISYCILNKLNNDEGINLNSNIKEYIIEARRKFKNQIFLFCSSHYSSLSTPNIRLGLKKNDDYSNLISEINHYQKIERFYIAGFIILTVGIDFMRNFFGEAIDIIMDFIEKFVVNN